jgi:hypothetical protein
LKENAGGVLELIDNEDKDELIFMDKQAEFKKKD